MKNKKTSPTKPRPSLILTNREREVINKKLKNKKLNQQDYNYLSKYVRPKLKEIVEINADELLTKLKYNQQAISIERKIKNLILKNIKEVKAIIIYGSVIQNNYTNYNDIDCLVIVKKLNLKLGKKYKKINETEKKAKEENLNLDVQIISEPYYNDQHNKNPNLIYQLKDSKVIYGKVRKNPQKEIPKLYLNMKLDYSTIDDIYSNGCELYKAVRNTVLVKLLMRGILNNEILNQTVKSILGESLIYKLKTNTASKEEKKQVLKIISLLVSLAEEEIKNSKWGKIKILSH